MALIVIEKEKNANSSGKAKPSDSQLEKNCLLLHWG